MDAALSLADSYKFGLFEFVISAILICCSSLLIAICFAQTFREAFWIFIASIAIHLGTISEIVSLVEQLNPRAWLLVQLLSLPAILLVCRPLRARLAQCRILVESFSEYNVRKYYSILGPVSKGLIIAIVGVVSFSFISRYLMPIDDFDSKMYHASRVLYWLQNQSISPYITHNDRQVAFPFGSELFFLWPVLFTKSELIGKLVFWLGYPLAVMGLYFLLRQLQIKVKLSLLGSLVFLATPIISTYSTNLKPEMWHVVFVLGTAFWSVRCCQTGNRMGKAFFLSGLFLSLTINSRFTGLFCLPAVFAIPWVAAGKETIWARVKFLLGGAVAGLVLSGLVVTTGFNVINYGHPLGSVKMRVVHQADVSPAQLYVHAVRFAFLLLEFPVIPISAVRELVEKLGKRTTELLGATQLLPLENVEGWPGAYTYKLPTVADRFSLGGLLWLPFLFWGIRGLIQEVRETYPVVRISPVAMLVILQLPLLWGDVFIARWMVSAGIPERLIIGPYALGIALTFSLLSKFVCVHKNVGTVAIFLIIAMMAIHLRSQYRFAATIFKARPISAHADRRYSEALSLISAGSRILFVGSQDATDYLFFAPRDGYANKVIPWGQFPFDPQRMQDLVRLNCVSHVLIENDHSVGFLDAPSISTTEMTSWLSNNSNFHSVDLITSGLRLFEVIASPSVLDDCKSETASNLVSPLWRFPLDQSNVAG